MNAPSFLARSALGATMLLMAATAPAQFVSDYNGTLINSGGGTTYAFAGKNGSDPLGAEYPFSLDLVNEGPGNDALSVSNSFPSGTEYTYYGITVELSPAQSGTIDLTQYSQLSFKIKANSETAHNEFVVRVEDADGAQEWLNTAYTIPPLTTTYQEIMIPLSFFEGGGQPADLTIARNITFGAVEIMSDGSTLEVGFTVDDVIVDGPPLNPPPVGFISDYNGTIINSGGGTTFAFAGADYADPLTGTYPFSLDLVNQGPDDDALSVSNSFPSGTGYTYYGITIELTPEQTGTLDLTQNSQLRFKIKANTETAHNTFVVRVEDSDGAQEWLNTAYTVPALTTEFQEYTIPLTFFQGGGQPADLTLAKNITFGAENFPNDGSLVEVNFTIDDVTVEGAPLETEPTDFLFLADYNGTILNSENGDTFAFAGADYADPLTGDFPFTLELVDEGDGNDSLRVANSFPSGFDYTYYGITIELSPGQADILNLTQASQLRFTMKINTPTAHNQFVVRVEDDGGGEQWNNTAFTIPNLTTDYQTITIPLTFFQGGGQPANLSRATNITFGAAGLPIGGAQIEVDFSIDDVMVFGEGTEPIPPVTNFLVNFNNQLSVSPTGGVIGTDWGYGNPFFVGPAPTSFVEVGPGNYAWEINGDLENLGDGFSFVAFFIRLDSNINAGRDVSTATHVRVDARREATDTLDWRVRLEDAVGDPNLEWQKKNWAFDPPLTSDFQTYMIPIDEFVGGTGGTGFVETDLTRVRAITIFNDAGPNTQTPTLRPRLTLDNVGFVFPTPDVDPGDANGDGVINVADVTAIHNFINFATPLAGIGDVNDDGDVDETDALLLIDHIVNGTPLP